MGMKRQHQTGSTLTKCMRSILAVYRGESNEQAVVCICLIDTLFGILLPTSANVVVEVVTHMPDHHHHHHGDGCGHETHDHDHGNGDVGPNDNLFPYIDRPHVVALNGTVPGSSVVKPWHERTNEQVVRDSRVT